MTRHRHRNIALFSDQSTRRSNNRNESTAGSDVSVRSMSEFLHIYDDKCLGKTFIRRHDVGQLQNVLVVWFFRHYQCDAYFSPVTKQGTRSDTADCVYGTICDALYAA